MKLIFTVAMILGTGFLYAQTTSASSIPSDAANLAKLEQQVQASPGSRPALIGYLAMLAIKAGDQTKANLYGLEALSNAAAPGPNQAVQSFYGNEVLGIIAMKQGNLEMAKTYLLASGRTKGNAIMAQFGPNMLLAKMLLDAGQKETVLEFLTSCTGLWTSGGNTLAQWRGAIREGAVPDFGRYLVMMP